MSAIVRRRPPVHDPAVFKQLVGLCHNAVIDGRAGWSRFLEKLCACIGANAGSLMIQEGLPGDVNVEATFGVDPKFSQLYKDYYHSVNIYAIEGAARQLLKPGILRTYHSIVPPSIAMRTEMYNDFMRRLDWHDGVSGVLAREGSFLSYLSVGSPLSSGLVGKEQFTLMKRITPHAQRALQIHRRLERLHAFHDAATVTLDQLPLGVIFVDGQGKPLFVNRVAQEILAQKDGLTLTREGFQAANGAATAAVRRYIHNVIQTGNGRELDAESAMNLPRPSLKRPLSIIAGPLPAGHPSSVPRSAAVIFVSDPEARADSTPLVLQRLYGLSPAEGRLAALLFQGRRLEEAAEELGISLHTARNQLKSIFQRTGSRRQSDLMRLLASGPAVIRQPRSSSDRELT
jgi:DNA-binding CsgD family transcriptional regulator/PAS domain-containing protein